MKTSRVRICATFLGAALAMFGPSIGAQTLCGVTKIEDVGSDGDFKVSFDGRKNMKISANGEGAGLVLDLKNRVTTNSAKMPTEVQAKRGDDIYVTDGLAQSCVIARTEHDGKSVFYIEEHFHAVGQPPRLLSEFVDAR